MKVANNETGPAVNRQSPPEPLVAGKAARFRSLLDKPDKFDPKKRPPRPTSKKQQDDQEASAAAVSPKPIPPEFRPITFEKVEAPRPVIEPKLVEGLVREITVISEADRNDVRIQFNSQTLDGLQIRISKENGNVSLQFFTTSMEVERVLQRNMDQLTQALIQRGVTISSNKIERVPAPPTSEQAGGRSSGGKRQQGRQR